MKYRIVEIKNGFKHNWVIEYKFKLFWLIPIWFHYNYPNYHITYESAEEYLNKLLIPETQIIVKEI